MARRISSDGDLIIDVEPGDESTEAFRSLRYGDAYLGTDNGDYVIRTGRQEQARITADGVASFGDALALSPTNLGERLYTGKTFVYSGATGAFSGFNSEATVVGASPAGPTSRFQGYTAYIKDAANVVNKAVSGAVSNGAGLIRLTATGHGMSTGDSVAVYGVTGTTEANGQWIITKVDANTVDLQGSTFTNAYVSGGTLTNRGAYYGFIAAIAPSLTRGSLTGTAAHGDDVNCFVGFNSGTGKGTDAFYLGRNSAAFPSSSEWTTAYTVDANCDYGIRLNGTFTNYGIDFSAGTFTLGAVRLKNNSPVVSRNAAGSADIELFRLDASNNLTFHATQVLATGASHTVDDVISFLQTKGLCKQS